MDYKEVEKGKELNYFSSKTIQNFIIDFSNDIKNQKEEKKFYKGASAYKEIENLEGENVDVWIEWNAQRLKGGLDIGITKCIFYKKHIIPDIVLDRWNFFSKELNLKNNIQSE